MYLGTRSLHGVGISGTRSFVGGSLVPFWGVGIFGTSSISGISSPISFWRVGTGADPGFGQGGASASEAKSCQCSEVESHE